MHGLHVDESRHDASTVRHASMGLPGEMHGPAMGLPSQRACARHVPLSPPPAVPGPSSRSVPHHVTIHPSTRPTPNRVPPLAVWTNSRGEANSSACAHFEAGLDCTTIIAWYKRSVARLFPPVHAVSYRYGWRPGAQDTRPRRSHTRRSSSVRTRCSLGN